MCTKYYVKSAAGYIEMAISGDKQLGIDDLAAILRDPLIKSCPYWKDIGLEIGLTNSDLNEIDQDYRGKTVDCKREMFVRWLENHTTGTLKYLQDVVSRVNDEREGEERNRSSIRKDRERNMTEAKREENDALFAVSRLQTLLLVWERRNENIVQVQKEFVKELEGRDMLMRTQEEEKIEEDRKWQQGEDARNREEIVRALGGHNYQSPFVKDLLRRKNIPMSRLNDEAVEGFLRQTLMDIDIARSKVMRRGYRLTKENYKRMEYLRNEIDKLNDLLDKRLRAYKDIKDGLEQIGVRSEKIEEINVQMTNLKDKVSEFREARNKCDKVYKQADEDYKVFEEQMNIFIRSFNANIEMMQKNQPGFVAALYALFGLAGGAAVGAVGGAVAGTAVVPVLGTVVGALLGGAAGSVSGLIWGIYKGQEAREIVNRKVGEYKNTLEAGQSEYEQVMQVLHG